MLGTPYVVMPKSTDDHISFTEVATPTNGWAFYSYPIFYPNDGYRDVISANRRIAADFKGVGASIVTRSGEYDTTHYSPVNGYLYPAANSSRCALFCAPDLAANPQYERPTDALLIDTACNPQTGVPSSRVACLVDLGTNCQGWWNPYLGIRAGLGKAASVFLMQGNAVPWPDVQHTEVANGWSGSMAYAPYMYCDTRSYQATCFDPMSRSYLLHYAVTV